MRNGARSRLPLPVLSLHRTSIRASPRTTAPRRACWRPLHGRRHACYRGGSARLVQHRRTRPISDQEPGAQPPPSAAPHHREVWRSPGGIGAIAAVAGVIVAVLGLFISNNTQDGNRPTSPSATFFFVYGTTMPDHLRYPEIEEYVAAAVRDRVTGRLYDTGLGYPAAKFGGGQSIIEGYRLEIRDGREEEARRRFTAFESGLFHPVTIRTESG
jgi:hypothetical protein